MKSFYQPDVSAQEYERQSSYSQIRCIEIQAVAAEDQGAN